MEEGERKFSYQNWNEKMQLIQENQLVNEPSEPSVPASIEISNPSVPIVSGIFKNKFQAYDISENDANSAKRKKSSHQTALDQALINHIKELKQSNSLLNGRVIQEKAREVAESLGVVGFQASKGWLERFKKRNAIVFNSSLKSDSELREEREQLLHVFNSIIERYEERDIFNAIETSLFFHCLPNDFRAFKGEKCLKGKFSKDRITILLCSNMDGSEKIKPLVIGRFGKPRCFKHVKKLPVNYQFNKLSWMTVFLFEHWLISIDEKFTHENRKVLFFISDSPAHPRTLQSKLKSITLAFFPSDSIYMSQPLELGVISSFKTYYRHEIILRCLTALENNQPLPRISLLHALKMLNEVWCNKVAAKTIKNSFKKASFFKPGLVREDLGLDEIENVAFNITAIETFKSFFAKTQTSPENYDDYMNLDVNVATTGDFFGDFLDSSNCDQNIKSEDDNESYNLSFYENELGNLKSNQSSSEVARLLSLTVQENGSENGNINGSVNGSVATSDKICTPISGSQVINSLQIIQQALLQCGDISNDCFEKFLLVKSTLKNRFE